MSISVNGVTRTSPIANSTTSATTAPAIQTSESGSQQIPQQIAPLRFPWLSRLTAELEPVARQKPAFPSAPALGENLDQAA
jgi:hypothetical protein